MAYPSRPLGLSFIESYMRDNCVVTRRPVSNREDELDLETFELTAEDEPEEIYSGKCTLQPFSAKDRNYDIAERPDMQKGYKVMLPASAGSFLVGDTLTLSSVAFNDQLVGVPLRVGFVMYGTHRLFVELWVTDVLPDVGKNMP